jgi:hypothetical protein
VPGAWLRRGVNTVVVFDLEQPVRREMRGLAQPILDQIAPAGRNVTGRGVSARR